MAKRPSLKSVTQKPDAAEAAKVAARIKAAPEPAQVVSPEAAGSLKTVSYNLPVEIVDLLRDLARKRADNVRRARARGEYTAGDARTSASKIVLDALIPHVDGWRKELDGD